MPDHVKKKLEEEIRQMEHELAHELPAEIKKAAALGDLSENAEYHMAKQRQQFVNARLGQMKKRMAELSLVNMANIPRDRVAFGSRVTVLDVKKCLKEDAWAEIGKVRQKLPEGRARRRGAS